MIKKNIFFTIVLILLSLKIFACQCIPKLLLDDIIDSKNIFIGKIIDANQNIYEIEILTVYKGKLITEKTYKVTQPYDSCHKNRFDINEIYVFFESLNDNGFHQCSRTKKLSESKILKTLEKIYPNRSINKKNRNSIEELIYNNIYLIRSNDRIIDTKDKRILYFDGKSIFNQPKKDFNSNWLNINYSLLFTDLKIDNEKYDYIIYYKISHQDFILGKAGKTKLRKKFLKKKNRQQL